MWTTGNSIVDMLNKIRQHGLEYTHRRFYSKYKGKVEINADPQQQGRVKVSVADTGKLNVDPTGATATAEMMELYAYPTSPFAGNNYGFYFPPEVNDRVWVWFDHGDPTQPNISGGWWLNPGTPSSSVTTTVPPSKSPITSQIPAEFVSSSLIPTTRGIKTKRGHGLRFEDDILTKDTGVLIWTGEPAPTAAASATGAPQPALPAVVHHELNFSDAGKYIRLETNGPPGLGLGHIQIWDDRPTFSGMKMFSVYGHTFALDDVTKSINLTTALGHQISISDTLNQIRLQTVLGSTIFMNDTLATISVSTPLQQSVILSDLTQQIAVSTPGLINITAGGLVQVTANGINLSSTGPAPCVTVAGGTSTSTFTGVVSNTYNGGVTQTVNGSYSDMISGPWTIATPEGTIGKDGTPKFFLVTEAFFDLFNAHTHAAPLSPPNIQIVPPTSPTQPIPDPLIIFPMVDERVVLTQDLAAS